MRRWILLLIAGLCWPAAPARAARAVDGYIGQRVVEVQLVADGRPLEDAGARDMVETRVGEPLSMRDVRESLAHLFSLGLYRAVEVGGGASRGGVALIYELQSLETIDRIEFAGARGVSEEALRRRIVQRHGAIFPAGEAEAVADTVRRAYAENGFFNPRVLHEATGAGPRRVLRISIDAGPRAFVRRWPIAGESPAFHNVIRTRLGLGDRQPYDGPALERRLGDYEADLRQRGYYEARLSHAVDRLSDTEVDVHLTVHRGPRIVVTFEGDEVPDARPADLVPVAREASADEDLLEDADQRIAAHLQGLGYRDAAVTHTREGDADRLSIVFRVKRGPLYRVGDLLVGGNRAVADETIRSLAGVEAGDPLVVREIDAGLAAIEEHYNRLGFATVLAVHSFSGGDSPGPGDVVERVVTVTIEEGMQTIVGAVEFDSGAVLRAEDLQQIVETRGGDAYYGPQVERDRNALLEHFLNDGYEQARVTVEAGFADDLSMVDLVFRIAEGRQVLVDHVLIVGNRQVDAATIRREVALTPGEPLGLDDVAETRRRLNALGMFRRLDIREFSHGRFDRRDVIIEVEEAAATRLAYGGGFEVSQRLRREVRAAGSQAVERIEFAPRGSFEIGRRNLWGRNRSLDLFTRVSVRRKNDPVPAGAGGDRRRARLQRVSRALHLPRAAGVRPGLGRAGLRVRGAGDTPGVRPVQPRGDGATDAVVRGGDRYGDRVPARQQRHVQSRVESRGREHRRPPVPQRAAVVVHREPGAGHPGRSGQSVPRLAASLSSPRWPPGTSARKSVSRRASCRAPCIGRCPASRGSSWPPARASGSPGGFRGLWKRPRRRYRDHGRQRALSHCRSASGSSRAGTPRFAGSPSIGSAVPVPRPAAR